VLKALEADDFEEFHTTTLAKRHSNTGAWLLEHSSYMDWLQADESKLLWCHGNGELPTAMSIVL
jgi:hypothetical protein